MSKIDDTIKRVPRRVVAGVLGITLNRVDELHRAGVFAQPERGYYDLIDTCNRYRRYKETRRTVTGYNDASTKLKQAQTRREEIRNAAMLGELLKAEDVEIMVTELARIFAAGLEGLPGRVSSIVAGMAEPAEIRKIILDETRAIRQQVAERVDQFADGRVG
ncbi:MAG: hypothetical protein OEQ39_01855 [Gammaproteobacteria bacterium]|nr:hypothetical protein [Gammaproteobacteria bacterium]MDH3467383.1 hypothetical protein [Gammaproteobacteria bacterium]